MRETLAIQALKHLSMRIGLLWVGTSGFGTPIGKTPDAVTADGSTRLIEAYVRAWAAYTVKNYLAAIEIATEDEA